MYFLKYRLRKTSLKKFVKILISEHPSIVNTLIRLKDLLNVHDSTFILCLHHYEQKGLGKCIS